MSVSSKKVKNLGNVRIAKVGSYCPDLTVCRQTIHVQTICRLNMCRLNNTCVDSIQTPVQTQCNADNTCVDRQYIYRQYIDSICADSIIYV